MPPARLRDVLDRRLAVVLGLCGALYTVVIALPSFAFRGERWFTLFDDAMISMTYARNLADGQGLVWTPGAPAVEGYTNPLWTVLMAALHRVGLPEQLVPLAVSLVGLGLLLIAIVLAAAVAARLAPSSRVAPVAAGVLTGLFWPLVYWTLRGMEVGLVTVVVLLLVWLALRAADAAGAPDTREATGVPVRVIVGLCVVAAVGLLTRDDVAVPVVVAGGWLVWTLRGRDRWRVVVPLAFTVVVVTVAHLAFRLAVYGEPLPNTYYLKVAGQPLAPRLERGVGTFVAVLLADLLLAAVVAVVGLRARLWRDRAVALCSAMVVALALYSVSVGGDAWEWARLTNRYLTPAAVLLLVLVAVAAEPFVERVRASRRPMAGFAVLGLVAVVLGLVDSVVGAFVAGPLEPWLGSIATTQVAAVTAVIVTAALALVAVVGLGRNRVPASVPSGRLAGLVVAAVLFATVANGWRSWVDTGGGFYTARNQGATAYGVALGEITAPDASIAVVWAGAPIYYARRPGVDLLGKMDPVIAHGPHHEGAPMYPGHDKYDFAHSIGDLRPDVVAQYAWFSDATVDDLLAWGYRPYRLDPVRFADVLAFDVPRDLLWVRDDTTRVDRGALVAVPVDEARAEVTAAP